MFAKSFLRDYLCNQLSWHISISKMQLITSHPTVWLKILRNSQTWKGSHPSQSIKLKCWELSITINLLVIKRLMDSPETDQCIKLRSFLNQYNFRLARVFVTWIDSAIEYTILKHEVRLIRLQYCNVVKAMNSVS